MRTSPNTTNNLEWKFQAGLIDYLGALEWMETRVKALQNKEALECVWLLEHPPLYTLGTSGHEKDILPTAQLPTFRAGRGGQVTYHGPGQRIMYLMLDLKERRQDIRWYVFELEEWIIRILSAFGVKGERRPGRVGIWVQKNGQDHKIAALGVRLQKWVTSHGIALNVNPDLKAYQDIIPCGLSHYGITSLADLGHNVTLEEVDNVSRETFPF
ncbi:MAG TPA: lipoyl(octanoyl) transferase LipB [Alphaproteobacteria bacterium]|nr:lipoyl(octanoyl) transferase LipB [Alphaproteobacteria bacterium]